MNRSPKKAVILGILCTGAHVHPATVVAQPQGYVLVARGRDLQASVREGSIRRDAEDARLVAAEVLYQGTRRAFEHLTMPDADRVRITVAAVRVDCEDGRLFERTIYFHDRDGNPITQVQHEGPGAESPAPPGSIGEGVVTWICSRPPTPPLDPPQSDARSAGSAFAVSAAHLLTTNHVVEGCTDVTVLHLDGTSFEGGVSARDARNDLALILARTTPLASIARFRSTGLRQGERVLAVGFSLAVSPFAEWSVSEGVVSTTAGPMNDSSQLQISAEVRTGKSGGPLLDSAGAVAGVLVSTVDAIERAQLPADGPENVGFAIKSELATLFLRGQGMEPGVAPVDAGAVAASNAAEAARSYTFLVECRPVG
jgi:S1-C subfamily serine protease